jgi:hypothetical protein
MISFPVDSLIYDYSSVVPTFPTLQSTDRAERPPIPSCAISGLFVHLVNGGKLYVVEDRFYQQNGIFAKDNVTLPDVMIDGTRSTIANDKGEAWLESMRNWEGDNPTSDDITLLEI